MLRRPALMVMVMALVLLGCSRGRRAKTERPVESAADRAVGTRLEAYTRCLDHSERVFQIADLYRGNYRNAPPSLESGIPVYAPEDPEKCLERIDEARAVLPPQPELDVAAAAYGAALEHVYKLTTAVHDHFDRESESYAPAKGVELHDELLAAFDRFDVAQATLFDQVFRLNRTVHLAQLAEREKKAGRTAGVIAGEMMLHAEGLVQLAGVAWRDLERIDAAALSEWVVRFESAFEELEGVVLTRPQSQDVTNAYWAVKRPAKAYATAARQLIARIRDNVPFSDAEKIMLAVNNEESVVGTPEAVVDAYNRLVEASHGLASR